MVADAVAIKRRWKEGYEDLYMQVIYLSFSRKESDQLWYIKKLIDTITFKNIP